MNLKRFFYLLLLFIKLNAMIFLWKGKRMAVEEEKGKVNVLICNTNNEGGQEQFCEEAFL